MNNALTNASTRWFETSAQALLFLFIVAILLTILAGSLYTLYDLRLIIRDGFHHAFKPLLIDMLTVLAIIEILRTALGLLHRAEGQGHLYHRHGHGHSAHRSDGLLAPGDELGAGRHADLPHPGPGRDAGHRRALLAASAAGRNCDCSQKISPSVTQLQQIADIPVVNTHERV
ncbi:MAG: hypothetical protein MZW92_49290 [Comamonadaceae bacterium]|nr:hypothetical protein [Comamonadaceae bacterium]